MKDLTISDLKALIDYCKEDFDSYGANHPFVQKLTLVGVNAANELDRRIDKLYKDF